MAELTEYREVREGHWVKEGEADTSRGQGNRLTITMKLSFQCEPNLTLQLGGRLQGHPIGREVEGLSITWITSWQGERSFLSPLPNSSGGCHIFSKAVWGTNLYFFFFTHLHCLDFAGFSRG